MEKKKEEKSSEGTRWKHCSPPSPFSNRQSSELGQIANKRAPDIAIAQQRKN